MITRETIELAYRLFLGRPPENEKAIDDGLDYFDDFEHLRSTFLKSEEFRIQWFAKYFDIDPGWVLVNVLGDLRIHLNLSDVGVSHPVLFGTYQPETVAFIEEHLDPDRDFIDFGANIGLMSLVAARKISQNRGKGRVFSFEPNPDIFPWLIRSIDENGFSKLVRVLPYAAADQVGVVPFHSDTTANFGSGSILSEAVARTRDSRAILRVPTIPAADVLPDADPGLVKIDVEGAEPLVLTGITDILERSRPIVLCEINDDQLGSVSNSSAEDLVDRFARLGYQPGDEEGLVTPGSIVEKARKESYFDVVFRPNELAATITRPAKNDEPAAAAASPLPLAGKA